MVVVGREPVSKLVFFRVNYPHWWGKDALERVLRHAFNLPAGQKGEFRNRNWYTGEFKELESGNWNFKLGKERGDLPRSTIAVKAGHYIFPEEEEGPVVPYVRCIYVTAKQLLVAETINEISWLQVKGSLESIFKKAHGALIAKLEAEATLGEIALNPLSKKSDFLSWANQQERILRVSFHFRPTNPRAGRSYEEWDRRLREAKSDETNLELRSKTEGLVVSSELVEVGLAQVDAGYGTANATGESQGVRRYWNSMRSILMRMAKKVDRKKLDEDEWITSANDAEKEAESRGK